MPSDSITVVIAFKTPAAPQKDHWTMSLAEAKRLAEDFKKSQWANSEPGGVYETLDDGKGLLAVRFADVLYIG